MQKEIWSKEKKHSLKQKKNMKKRKRNLFKIVIFSLMAIVSFIFHLIPLWICADIMCDIASCVRTAIRVVQPFDDKKKLDDLTISVLGGLYTIKCQSDPYIDDVENTCVYFMGLKIVEVSAGGPIGLFVNVTSELNMPEVEFVTPAPY